VAKGKRAPADPDKFSEASQWFRSRTPVTKSEWNAMSAKARRQAFTVAGTQQLKVVQTVFAELQKAIDKGTPIDEWRKSIKKKIKGEFADKNSATLTTAFINANQTAYNTGRYYQLNDPAVTAVMPYQIYDAVLDDRTSPTCNALSGTTRRHDDPWWLTHWPPMHHRCRSSVRALSAAMAKRRGGITETLPRPVIPSDFGLAPPLRAGQIWEPDLSQYDPSAAREYQRKQGRMKSANDNAGTKPKRPRRKRKG
jgi:SPP1 gp7 family putative phage head morphogenesis protein